MPRPSPRTDHTLFSPLFVACVAVLAAGAVGLRPAMGRLATRYLKEPIPLRRSLTEFDPAGLPSFRAVPNVDTPELETGGIGTDEVVLSYLEDTAPDTPGFQIATLVTYYSDPRDKVPHTPEVCARQAGITVSSVTKVPLRVPDLYANDKTLTMVAVDINDAGEPRLTCYLFCANGEFCDTRNQVRWVIGRPGDKYTYFSKIEATVAFSRPNQRQQALETCEKLLGELIPLLVNEYFPDSADLRRE